MDVVTSAGVYTFEPIKLTLGMANLDLLKARERLLSFKRVLDSGSLPFFLMYGTLLGAVREGNLIAHDQDIDVGVFAEHRQTLIDLLFTLRAQGFELIRFDEALLSFRADPNYIDVYIYKRNIFGQRRSDSTVHERGVLERQAPIRLFGENFMAPAPPEAFLRQTYGPDWRVPKVNAHAVSQHKWARFKRTKIMAYLLTIYHKIMGR